MSLRQAYPRLRIIGLLKLPPLLLPIKLEVYVAFLRGKDKKMIRDSFQFPSSIKIRISDGDDRACHFYTDKVCFYEADFVSGICLPIHPLIRELFFLLQLAPAQLVSNSWRIVVYCIVVWMSTNDRDTRNLSHREGFQGWFLTPLHLFEIGKPTFSSSLVMARSSLRVRI